MKNFKNFTPEKYAGSDFQEVEEGIYKTKSPYEVVIREDQGIYVTSLTFEFEPERYGVKRLPRRICRKFPLRAFWMNLVCL